MLKNFKEAIKKAKTFKKTVVVVPVAEDDASLSAVIDGHKMGLCNGVLIGNRERMTKLAKELSGKDLADFDIIESENPEEAAEKACLLCREKKADIILKGNLQTSMLLKAVLNAEKGLRTDHLLSDIFIFEDPLSNSERLVAITDGGITPLPTLDQKKQIIENAVLAFHRLGKENPKVAVLSAVEKPSPAVPSTLDAAELKKMNREGIIKGCVVDGPLALDNAVSKWCAEMKGIKSEVSGEADIFVMPNIEAGNIFAKSMIYYMKAKIGHVLVGAKAPVLINSRTDDGPSKLHSIVLAIIAGIER